MSAMSEYISELNRFLEDSSTEREKTPLSIPLDYQSSLYAMGYELYRNGKYEDGKDFFRFLTLVNSFERKYWIGLAACYQMMKKYPEAIECYSAAAVQDPSDPYVHLHAADCYFHSNNYIKAKEALESATMVAKENKDHIALLPKLKLIDDVWSKLPNGVTNA